MTLKRTEIILAAATEAQAAIDKELRSRTDIAGTGFDQCGMQDGLQIVRGYLDVNETGVALDHLRYMIEETGILISETTQAALDDLCWRLGVRRFLWQSPRP